MPIPFIVWALGGLLLTIAIVLVLRPNQQSETLEAGEVETPQVEEGKPIRVIFGIEWVRDPQVVFFGDIEIQPVRKQGGKKG